MAIKFQYNKTSLQQLEKQLKVRVRTLPIIKNKESALRMGKPTCTYWQTGFPFPGNCTGTTG